MPEEEAPGVIAQLKTAIQNWQQRGEKICRALNLDLTQSSDPFADETRPPEGQAT
jgi:hypothetical protein